MAPNLRANLGHPLWETIWATSSGVPHLGANLGCPIWILILVPIWGALSWSQSGVVNLGTISGTLIWEPVRGTSSRTNQRCPNWVKTWDWCPGGTPEMNSQMEDNLESHLEANVVCNNLSVIFGSQSVAPQMWCLRLAPI